MTLIHVFVFLVTFFGLNQNGQLAVDSIPLHDHTMADCQNRKTTFDAKMKASPVPGVRGFTSVCVPQDIDVDTSPVTTAPAPSQNDPDVITPRPDVTNI